MFYNIVKDKLNKFITIKYGNIEIDLDKGVLFTVYMYTYRHIFTFYDRINLEIKIKSSTRNK
jgi:hypothetical protein